MSNFDEQMKKTIADSRTEIERSADLALGRRRCSNCGAMLHVHHGRVSGMWFLSHDHASECVFDKIGCRIFFKTKEEGLNAEEVFREP
jgi:hypothetical protein